MSYFRPASLELVIAISGGELTAHYTLTASSGTALIEQALAAQNAETGNLMVDNLLGQVSVRQFHYGLTGNQRTPSYLGFGPPQLQVTGNKTIVTISSAPFRLSLDQQYIRVAPPTGLMNGSPEDLQVKSSSAVQVLDVSGARRISISKDDTELLRPSSSVTAEAVLREPGQNWTTGLRAMGGITLPIAGGLLARLDSMFVYIVLLWSFAKAAKEWPGNQVLAVGRNAVSTIVGALVAMAVLSFCYQLIFELISDPKLRAPALAGPMGLLTGGVVLMWPAACWRVTPPDENAPDAAERTVPKNGRRLLVMAMAAVAYLIVLYFWLGINPLSWQVVPSTAGIVVLVYLLVNAVLSRSDRKGPVSLAILVGMLAAVLGATVTWPVLVYTGFRFRGDPALYVNVLGKWTYFAAAAITAIGLCVLAVRVIGVISDSRIRCPKQAPVAMAPSIGPTMAASSGPSRRIADRLKWPWFKQSARRRTSSRVGPDGTILTTAVSAADAADLSRSINKVRWRSRAACLAVTAVALVAIVPSLVAQAQVGDPHATGLVPANLTSFSSGLYHALPQLLNWLLLGLAVAVLLSISRAPDAPGEVENRRIAIRGIAIPVMMLLLYSVYSGGTWLYVPITLIGGLMILAWLVLPTKVAKAPRTHAPKEAIHLTLTARRRAEFADGQRQKLIGDSDDLREALNKDGMVGYERTFDALASAQAQLAARCDLEQQKAQVLVKEAFDHRGEPPDPKIARWGAVIGALLGFIPASVLLLATRPVPSSSGYPVLDFLGYTGWILFIWPALGWSIGYFLPYIQGSNGIEKALWVFAAAAASLPMNLLWLNGQQWATALIYYLELFSFLLVISVILCDLIPLTAAGMRLSAWTQIHNWRFLITWSTALLAAIGTAAVTFLTTAVTDLSQQTISTVTGQGSSQSQTVAGTGHGAPSAPGSGS